MMGETTRRLPKLDVEDCAYIVRELERNAFSHVVAAMRAQGILNNSKELLLERLKDVLFISDEIYKGEIRKAANDEFLTEVAKVLNPHYDTFTCWGMVSREVEEDVPIFPPVQHFDTGKATTSTLAMANALLKQATNHNDVIEKRDICTMNLLSFPNVPFVPEKMRKLFRDTECLPSQRILPRDESKVEEQEILAPKIIKKEKLPPAAKSPISKMTGPVAKRKRKAKLNGLTEPYEEPPLSLITTEKPSTSTTPIGSPPTAAPALLLPSPIKHEPTSDLLKSLLPSKDVEAMGVKEFINKIQAQIEREQRNGLLNDTGKRKRKPRISSTIEVLHPDCARARPFERKMFGPKPYKPKSERLTMKRQAPGAGSPIMVPPVTPPHPNGSSLTSPHAVPVQVIPPATIHHPVYPEKNLISSQVPSTSNFDPHLPPSLKENAIRPGNLPLNHAINKTATSNVPVAGQAQIIKRPRLSSYTDPKLPTSPVDLSKATTLKKAAYLQPSPAANKVKVAVTPPVEVHGQAVPSTSAKPAVYGHQMAVTVNRTQNRVVTSVNPQPMQRPSPAIIQQPNQLTELHGHDYSLSKSPLGTTVIKKTVITNATVPPVIRTINGSGIQKHIQVTNNLAQLPAQTIVREQVIVKKPNPTTPTTPLGTTHKPSPPPNAAVNPIQSPAIRKYMMTGVLPSTPQTQNHTSVGQLVKVSKSPAPVGQVLDGTTAVKRIYYSETATPTNVTNIDTLTEKEKLILRATAERERALRTPVEIRAPPPKETLSGPQSAIQENHLLLKQQQSAIHRVAVTSSSDPLKTVASLQILPPSTTKSTPPPVAVDQPSASQSASSEPPRPEIIQPSRMEIT